MARPRHPSKEIEAAVRHAEALGWAVRTSKGHAWGRLFCPLHTPEGCIVVIWSTPRSAENHARAIRRKIEMCRHSHRQEDSDGNA